MRFGELLWSPSQDAIERTNMVRFIKFINERYGILISNYNELWQWSVDNISTFWGDLWEFLDIKCSKSFSQVVDDPYRLPGAKWFIGAELNFAENLLRYRDEEVAIVSVAEKRDPINLTYRDLYKKVAALSRALKKDGVSPGDRVAGFMPNIYETVVAMLSATSLGAIWSSCSPDFGRKGVLDRFGQIEPKVLFTADGYYYNGKKYDSLERVREILKELPSIKRVVVVPFTGEKPDISGIPNAVFLDEYMEEGEEIEFVQLPSDHPLYIMYSSGTTGLPKCMVQGAAGILVNHLKELVLHTDLKRDDVIFYYTTCGWMMWNWLVSSLAVGATVVLYDGSPFYPGPDSLWRMAQDLGITVFGTSARYLAAIEKEGVEPKRFDLSRLRAILSTGSPLALESFYYVYGKIKRDVCLSSISGGTDINGCFFAGNPMGPVYAGELQCRTLGMKVAIFNEKGRPILNEPGELVCLAASPSMPLYFWNDPDGKKYKSAYFDVFPGVWRHGDYAKITYTGGAVIYGRSDATLNPGGVRIGTADIYRVVETIDEVVDSLAVGQKWKGDERIILFVKLRPGAELTEELKSKIKKALRENLSPRHVPAKIVKVRDIPYTINMKKVEIAVRNIIHGLPVLNTDALANPECLEEYRDIPELQED